MRPPASFSHLPSVFHPIFPSFRLFAPLSPFLSTPVPLNRDIRGTAAHSFAHSHTTLVYIHSLIHSFNTFVLHEDTGRLSRRYAPGNLLTVLYNVITSIPPSLHSLSSQLGLAFYETLRPSKSPSSEIKLHFIFSNLIFGSRFK